MGLGEGVWGRGQGPSAPGPLPQQPMNKTTFSLRRFFASPERFQGGVVTLGQEESHHLQRVLRLGVGASVVVCNGRGREVEAEVQALASEETVLTVVRELSAGGESSLACTLAIGLAKGEAMDAVIRQATEMGVQHIVPFTSARSERLSPPRGARRRDKWLRLARESLKSCQRSYLPDIAPVSDFAQALPGPEEVKLIFWEEERQGGLMTCLTDPRPAGVRVLIGPEGGFSPEEVALARESGYRPMSLGPRRLRVQTAALTAMALIQYAWGDLA